VKKAWLLVMARISIQPVPGRLAGNLRMVEAGGQHIRSFRCGLDYAFIHHARMGAMDAERVIQPMESCWILVLALGSAPSASL
jgi:hypothetical protein